MEVKKATNLIIIFVIIMIMFFMVLTWITFNTILNNFAKQIREMKSDFETEKKINHIIYRIEEAKLYIMIHQRDIKIEAMRSLYYKKNIYSLKIGGEYQ